ncbi:PAS domain S-box protein [Methylobacter sp.]|uniref:PAS domain S-box protein n=1 Tax=Methylobacter sp. TaxID=2051955 RepID=UPI0011F99DE8|nr:PAS domain S-box protein [Methylobacter sp.]TAK64398.1 MAG: PAS domain S-box protein [Methylobacter sp.]
MNYKLNPNTLRAEAEAQLNDIPVTASVDCTVEELLHELQVHQIELEMQNENLQHALAALEEPYNYYENLYDCAPVGYLTLTHEGLIDKINLTAANMFGADRSELLNCRFACLVAPKDGDYWYLLFADIIKRNDRQNTELMLKRSDNTEFYVQLDYRYITSDSQDPMLVITLTDITKRKQSEQLLKDSETKLRAVFNATPDAMLISNEQGFITQANRQAVHLLGYSINELLALSIEALMPERFRAAHPALRTQFAALAAARPMALGCAVKALRKDGNEVDVEIRLSPIQSEQGMFIACAMRDITERKQAEIDLRESEQRFRRMADSSSVMIWITDVKGEPIFANQSWLDFTGVESVQVMTHKDWINTIHPADRETVFVAYYQNTGAHKAIDTEYRLRNAKGNWCWILDKGIPLHDENGVFTGYIGSAIDITERKQIENEVLSTKNQLQATLNAIPDLLFDVDSEGRFYDYHASRIESLATPPEQFLGKTITDILPADAAAIILSALQETQQQGKSIGKQFKLALPQGDLWFELSVAVKATDDNEQLPRFVMLSRDITERKHMEEALKASKAFTLNILNSLSAHIAVLDDRGVIVAINRAWQQFNEQNSLPDASQNMLGSNYFHAFTKGIDRNESEEVEKIQRGITAVMAGEQPEFHTEYSCHSPNEQRWFYMTVLPLQGVKQGVVISHENITERKYTQQLLQNKEQMLSESQRIAHIGSWSVELATNCVSWSDEIYRIFNVTPETFEHSFEAFLNLIHPDDRAVMEVWLWKCMAEKQPRELDFRILLSNGSVRFIRGSGGLQYDNMQRPLRMVGSMQDITESKVQANELKRAKQRYDLATSIGKVGVWDWNPITGDLIWNDETFRIFGFEPSSVQPSLALFLTLVHPEDRKSIINAVEKALDKSELYSVDFRSILKNGEEHFYHSTGEVEFNESGEAIRVLGTFQDITEQKQKELDLRIAAVAFESQEAIVITDTASIILKVNKAFIDSTGYTKEEVVGQKISLLKSGRHDKAFYASMWESLLNAGAWQGEIWDRRKNGEIYPKWLSITGIKDSKGVVTHYVGMHTDITERKTAEQKIQQLAFYDPLTELPNRRLLQERLKHSINVEKRDGKQVALLMLDLDRFKTVNDSLGHLAGDELLQQVAVRITARLREVDMVARLGGDEFIVLLEDIVQPEDASRVAEEIIAALAKPFCLTQSDNVQIGASIGISLYPQHGDTPETLMDHADAALYQAKDAGRNCFAYFSKHLTLISQERILLEARLRRAVEQQELLVYYQPQVDIASGLIVGAEALVRWQNPIEGLLQPLSFISIAEETGLIVEIGGWVLHEACRQGRQWLDMGLPPLTLAVNISPYQFRRSNICALVAKVLSDTGFPANQLELEITESGLMENQNKTIAILNILNNLRSQGVHLAIDDFGTGYSSLAYLKHFPLDVLKIDQSFINDIPFHQDDMEIASTIVSMGHILGLKIMAEGVETQEQLDFLREKGCDSYQGFIKSKPLPAEEFAGLLHNQQRNEL